jgi:hypothetical protein
VDAAALAVGILFDGTEADADVDIVVRGVVGAEVVADDDDGDGDTDDSSTDDREGRIIFAFNNRDKLMNCSVCALQS